MLCLLLGKSKAKACYLNANSDYRLSDLIFGDLSGTATMAELVYLVGGSHGISRNPGYAATILIDEANLIGVKK